MIWIIGIILIVILLIFPKSRKTETFTPISKKKYYQQQNDFSFSGTVKKIPSLVPYLLLNK